jgi:hypothetical protein
MPRDDVFTGSSVGPAGGHARRRGAAPHEGHRLVRSRTPLCQPRAVDRASAPAVLPGRRDRHGTIRRRGGAFPRGEHLRRQSPGDFDPPARSRQVPPGGLTRCPGTCTLYLSSRLTVSRAPSGLCWRDGRKRFLHRLRLSNPRELPLLHASRPDGVPRQPTLTCRGRPSPDGAWPEVARSSAASSGSLPFRISAARL